MLEKIKSMLSQNVPQIFFFVGASFVFYFLIIRPKQKEAKKKDAFMKNMQAGTKVVTIGGLHGKVVEVGEKTIVLEIDRKGSQITVIKEAVSMQKNQSAQAPAPSPAPAKEKRTASYRISKTRKITKKEK